MAFNKLGFSCLLLLLVVNCVQAQESPLSIFGYFQSTTTKTEISSKGTMPNGTEISQPGNNFLSSIVQQANIFFHHQTDAKFTAWLNIEILNNYNSDRNWGSIKLEEAWGRFDLGKGTNIKAGKLIPAFNNLNEIKNRTPFLPYILRPTAYETAFTGLFPISALSPQDAFLQLTNQASLGPAYLKTDIFVGNAEENFRLSETLNTPIPRGTDTTNYVTVGGRFGVQYDFLSAGASTTFDRENVANQNAIRRWRFGGDLRLLINRLTFEGELTLVKYDTPNASEKYNKVFYYGTLHYDLSDQLFIYTAYNKLKDKNYIYLGEGADIYSVGGGFQVYENVKLKLQYVDVQTGWQQEIFLIPVNFSASYKAYSAAISVMF